MSLSDWIKGKNDDSPLCALNKNYQTEVSIVSALYYKTVQLQHQALSMNEKYFTNLENTVKFQAFKHPYEHCDLVC